MDRSDLQQLSKEQLIELVLQLQRPDKTSRTSSKPPSTDKKEKRVNSRPGGGQNLVMSRTIVGWPIIPTKSADHRPTHCGLCGGAVTADAEMALIGEYDEIEIPPVKPHVIRHPAFRLPAASIAAPRRKLRRRQSPPRRRSGRASMRWRFITRGFQALSYERLRLMFRDAFGLCISEGALIEHVSSASHARFKIEAEKGQGGSSAPRVL